jgi:trigger factor
LLIVLLYYAMKVHIEPVSPIEKKLHFEIPPERVGEEIEKAYRSVQQNARLKGFRAGKIPRPLLERHFAEQVAAEVSSILIEESYVQALEEHALAVVTRPQVVTEKLIPGQPFRYAATVEVKPEIKIADYEDIEVEKKVGIVEEQELEEALARLADSYAQLIPVTDRDMVECGDVVRLDYVAFANGKPIAGMQGKGQLIEVNKQERLFPGFQERLVGVRKGTATEFSLPFPESEDSLEGPERVATFRVTVHEMLRKEVPTLDDEFAKDHGECATLEELREKVRANLQAAVDRRAEAQLENDLVSQLLVRNPFDIPPSLIREQEHRLLLESGLVRSGEDPGKSLTALPEALRTEVSARAQRQVQTALLLDALANHARLSVSEEEIHQRIEEIAAASGVERQQQITAFYERAENHRALQNRLLQEKTLRFVVDRVKIKTGEKGVAGGKEKE